MLIGGLLRMYRIMKPNKKSETRTSVIVKIIMRTFCVSIMGKNSSDILNYST